MAEDERSGIPAHVASEFYLWLWWEADVGTGEADLGEGGRVTWWVDDRIAFRSPGEERPSAVMTGEQPAAAPESRAALLGGKVLRDVRIALRREEREYVLTLKGSGIRFSAAKLPGVLKTGDVAEILYERMFLYEDLHFAVGGLFRRFTELRTSAAWREEVLPDLVGWASGAPPA
jgi:hypothetical protein